MPFEDLELLTSPQNKLVKLARSLQNTRLAKKRGLMLLEGLRQIETAALAARSLDALLVADTTAAQSSYQKLIAERPQLVLFARRVDPQLFAELTDTQHSQGLLALAAAPQIIPLSSLAQTEQGAYVALEDCRDPGNMGAIIRSAEALGVTALILVGDCVWPYNSKSLRAAMGSSMYLPIYQASNLTELTQYAEKLDFLAADLAGEKLWNFHSPQRKQGFVLLLGNEAHGLSSAAKEAVDLKLSIEMSGRAESLNLANSMAIMTWYLRHIYS